MTGASQNEPTVVPLMTREIVAMMLIGSRRGLSARKISLLGARFDVTANALRVALFRMVATGEVVANDRSYRATSRLSLASLGWSHALTTIEPWNGRWQMIVGTPASADPSVAGRLLSAGFAEYCDRVWLCPSSRGPIEGTGNHFVVTPEEDSCRLAERLWALREWNARAGWFNRQCNLAVVNEDCKNGMGSPLQLAIGAYAHLHTAPRLPRELLPHGWLDDELLAVTDNLMDRLVANVARWRQVLR